jgi:acyl carrier protein
MGRIPIDARTRGHSFPHSFFDMSNQAPSEMSQTPAQDARALEAEVAGLIVSALNLDAAPGDIEPDAPLYGEGLGLDSIDILEIALVVSKRYGFHLRADNEDNVRIFRSLRSLSEHIAAQRTQ